MNADRWLEPWLPLIAQHAGGRPVLELGCGDGADTAILAASGNHVVAIDVSAASLAAACQRVPSCEFHCQDIRAPFPAPAQGTGVVVASLVLHYFPWHETLALARRIHEVLAPRGLLLCRVNSTNDHHYGATGHPAIEPHFHLVAGKPKRFFDQASVAALFARGWRIDRLEEKVIHRYAHPKQVWEAVLERVP